jgi:hypothetical protein
MSPTPADTEFSTRRADSGEMISVAQSPAGKLATLSRIFAIRPRGVDIERIGLPKLRDDFEKTSG